MTCANLFFTCSESFAVVLVVWQRIICPSIRLSICLSVRLAVRLFDFFFCSRDTTHYRSTSLPSRPHFSYHFPLPSYPQLIILWGGPFFHVCTQATRQKKKETERSSHAYHRARTCLVPLIEPRSWSLCWRGVVSRGRSAEYSPWRQLFCSMGLGGGVELGHMEVWSWMVANQALMSPILIWFFGAIFGFLVRSAVLGNFQWIRCSSWRFRLWGWRLIACVETCQHVFLAEILQMFTVTGVYFFGHP